ncbi:MULTISPECIES: LEA type 2 family protein [unclassified Caballeronia]|uniref:LEA type 2 family protein n=1 Tax=unclassified Caballeronia TaxID=2646786 RepID=UPI0028666D38|nr:MULTISPECIES: LEA type 2 family protein [unclassified Caballeronia]MDR5817698.1 LEA type 2 family protein [Caballeronia sp. LZ033]MDR5824640.1 LEA type 2 family protein [Caballeronia sp. LZ043]MDR5882534.1 LEA type 2 family protein [Caballeronia sp. LZ032]
MQANHPRSRFLLFLAGLAALFALHGCAGFFNRDAMRVTVAGIEPLEGQGLEMRFTVKLRVQNPNNEPLDFDGVALDLDLNGRPFATGVSDQRGVVPRFGETVVAVPVTVSAFSVARQALGFATGDVPNKVSYAVRGKLAGGLLGGARFADTGYVDLPMNGASGY